MVDTMVDTMVDIMVDGMDDTMVDGIIDTMADGMVDVMAEETFVSEIVFLKRCCSTFATARPLWRWLSLREVLAHFCMEQP